MEYTTINLYLLLLGLSCLTDSLIAQPKRESKIKVDFNLESFHRPTIQAFKGKKLANFWNETLWDTIKTDEDGNTLIAENIQSFRLSCTAAYPLRWTLKGLTGFSFVSRSTLYPNKSTPTGIKEYEETLIIDHLAEPYTGKYICDSKEFPDHRSSVFIFVPGNELFVNPRGKNIYFDRRKAEEVIKIPCGVSHPDVSVTLYKSNKDSTEIRNVNSYYNAKAGFALNYHNSTDEDVIGRYLCVARSRNIVRVVEYTVILDDHLTTNTKCNKACEENSHCKLDPNGYESCECDPSFKTFDEDSLYFTCLKKCKSDDDCPSSMSCLPRKNWSMIESDLPPTEVPDYLIGDSNELTEWASVCKNPCIFQTLEKGCFNNANNTLCRVNNHHAVC